VLPEDDGSPEATRRAFNKRFLLDLAEDWQQHGREVFKRVRRESPASYLKVCAMLVPREVKLEHSTSAIKAMTDEQIEQAIEVIQTMLAARAGDQAKVIEAVSEPVALPAPSRKPRRKRGAEAKASARSRHRGGNEARVMVFRQALQALGWTEGRNVQFIYRWSAGEVTHARPFAKELVDLRSDVILANSTPVAVAVRDTTRTTPTVFVQVSDPVTAGVVQSLERPGGNLTGFTSFEPSIASKWLELVKRVAPNITRVAYLFNPSTAPLFYARAVEGAAPLLSIKPFAAAVHDADEMEPVIEQFAREPIVRSSCCQTSSPPRIVTRSSRSPPGTACRRSIRPAISSQAAA
jgi:ABC transporter substrate binding protein